MPKILKALLPALAVFFLVDAPLAMAQQKPVDAALLAKGEYLARAGDCIACHTAREGKTFAGGLPMRRHSARSTPRTSRRIRKPASGRGRPISSTR
jgi:mono/diheme cytochrome c family protein